MPRALATDGPLLLLGSRELTDTLPTPSAAMVVFGGAIGMAILVTVLSFYRIRVRKSAHSSRTFTRVALQTSIVSALMAGGILGVTILGGIRVQMLVTTPAHLAHLPPVPVLVLAGIATGMFLFLAEYGLHITLKFIGLPLPESARRFEATRLPAGFRQWVLYLVIVTPLSVGAYELVFRAAVIGGGTLAGFPTWSVFLLSIGLNAVAEVWAGLRTVLVTGYRGAILGLAFVHAGILVPLVAVLVREILGAIARVRYFDANPE